MCLINQSPRHEDVCGSGSIAPPFLISTLDGGESYEPPPPTLFLCIANLIVVEIYVEAFLIHIASTHFDTFCLLNCIFVCQGYVNTFTDPPTCT
jgi:hypothetical protein